MIFNLLRYRPNSSRWEKVLAVCAATLLYLAFFYRILNWQNTFWESDVATKHYPSREYLRREILYEHSFPFWSERVFLGFPLYADLGSQYLNPVNVLSILLFGPVTSYKVVHFLTYLVGAYAFYLFIKRRGGNFFSYLTAILIFYFGFFHLNHLIHYDIIPVALLLPLNILLADFFVETGRKKYILFQALVFGYGLYWGHPQTTFLIGLCVFLYLFIIGNIISLKGKLLYLAFVFLIAISISLPQIIPAYRLYSESRRAGSEFSSSQGSLTPELTLSYIFPYLWSTSGYYYGEDIDETFSYTETYNYVGISALTLGLIYILFSRKDKFFRYIYSLIWCILILVYIRYVPVLNNPGFPVISMFRYWPRAIMLLSFSLALMSSELMSSHNGKIHEIKFDKKSVLLALAPVFFLTALHFININDPVLNKVHQSIVHFRFDLLLKRDILLWAVIPVFISLALLAVKKFGKRIALYIPLFVFLITFLDLRYFGADPLSYRILKWSPDPGVYTPVVANYKRVIEEGDLVLGMKPLLGNSYTPYGYSQFVNNDYQEFFEKHHLGKSPRASYRLEFLRENLNLDDLKNYGFTFARTENSFYQLRHYDTLDFTKNELKGKYLIKTDGHIKVESWFSKNTDLETVIRYDPNWNISVNGKRIKPEIWEDIFIKIRVPEGENIIEFKYIPYDFIYGIIAGAVSGAFLIFLLFSKRLNLKI